MASNFPAAHPIAIFVYNRLDLFVKTIGALKKCGMAPESELFIFSDGPKKDSDENAIEQIRTYAKSIDGFYKLNLHFSQTNKGLASSIKGGVSLVLETNDAVIVLEDDLIASSNFLSFMNQGLLYYKSNQRVLSISGYTVPIKTKGDYPYQNYFTRRASSWGWATWKDRWDKVDWEVSDYDDFRKDSAQKRKFNEMGSDMAQMLRRQMEGKLSSWAIVWCYHQFKHDLLSVFPIVSKITNDGFGDGATHTTGGSDRVSTPLDTTGSHSFNFDPEPNLSPFFIKQFSNRYSLGVRAYYKLKALLKL